MSQETDLISIADDLRNKSPMLYLELLNEAKNRGWNDTINNFKSFCAWVGKTSYVEELLNEVAFVLKRESDAKT